MATGVWDINPKTQILKPIPGTALVNVLGQLCFAFGETYFFLFFIFFIFLFFGETYCLKTTNDSVND